VNGLNELGQSELVDVIACEPGAERFPRLGYQPVAYARSQTDRLFGAADGDANHPAGEQDCRFTVVKHSGSLGFGDKGCRLRFGTSSNISEEQRLGDVVSNSGRAERLAIPGLVDAAKTSLDATHDDSCWAGMTVARPGGDGLPAGREGIVGSVSLAGPGAARFRSTLALTGSTAKPGQHGLQNGAGCQRVVGGQEEQLGEQRAGSDGISQAADGVDQVGWGSERAQLRATVSPRPAGTEGGGAVGDRSPLGVEGGIDVGGDSGWVLASSSPGRGRCRRPSRLADRYPPSGLGLVVIINCPSEPLNVRSLPPGPSWPIRYSPLGGSAASSRVSSLRRRCDHPSRVGMAARPKSRTDMAG
jgi:hypothetical protein